jgi:molecular chaperone GrpE
MVRAKTVMKMIAETDLLYHRRLSLRSAREDLTKGYRRRLGRFEKNQTNKLLKRGELMMADEMQKDTGAAMGKVAMQPDRDAEEEVSQVSQPGLQAADETVVWKDKYVRLFADLENTKKRLARSSAQEVAAEKEAILRDILPVADGLDLALMHTSREADNRSILQGIEMVRKILDKFFNKYDVKAIDAWGKPFDPNLHEAIGVARDPKLPPNTVVRVEQKGYLHRDKLLRPAQVLVTPR